MDNAKTDILSETLNGTKLTDSVSENIDTGAQSRRRARGFGVAASPFNGIKLELGLCAMLGVLLWLGADSITADEGEQLLLLLAFSLLATAWLVLRTRAVLRRWVAEEAVRESDEKK
jgi:hypothetical protein